jgi:hypothetical protein
MINVNKITFSQFIAKKFGFGFRRVKSLRIYGLEEYALCFMAQV